MRPLTLQTGYTEQDAIDLLASSQFVFAECFKIVPKYGPSMLYTNAPKDVVVIPVDGNGVDRVAYRAGEVIIDGLRSRTSMGIEVDDQEVDLSYPATQIFQAALTFPQALRLGRLDGAIIRRDRFIAATWSTPWVAGMPMFSGSVSSLDNVGRQSATLSVSSDLSLLNVEMPRDEWEPPCKHSWGDEGCGLDQALHVVQTTIGAGPSRTVIPWAGATDEFLMGKVNVEGDDDVTRVRTISKVNVGVSVEVIYPLDFDPIAGQAVAFYPNCRRVFDKCGLYHAEPEKHYLGFPHIPVAETAA